MKSPTLTIYHLTITMVIAFAVSACGGGGGSSSPSTGTVTPTASPTVTPTVTATPVVTATPSSTPTITPTPVPVASLTISGFSVSDTGAVSLTGSSAGVSGDISVSFNAAQYSATPDNDGSWSAAISGACDASIADGSYSVTADGVDGSGGAVSDNGNYVLESNIFSVGYLRSRGNYDGWGLHLWNAEGEPLAFETLWEEPYAFTCEQDGWMIAKFPYIDETATLGVIAHKGSLKNTPANIEIQIQNYPDGLWIVQANPTLYSSLASADLAKGAYSDTIDTSAVVASDTDNGLVSQWNQSANFIQIFVRSYKDSDGDGIGDFQGLIDELDYLQALGINGIWLMPITESYDNDHGYSVLDYRSVEQDYGTLQDFQTLLTEAHARDIGIIIDYVVNHSSYLNPVFVDANFSDTNDKRDWFIFAESDQGWTPFPSENVSTAWFESTSEDFYYGAFGSSLPDFNLANQEVVDFHLNNMRYWLNMGVDGFRLDAVGVLFEDELGTDIVDNENNHPFLSGILDLVNSYTNRYLVCEAPEDTIPYAQPDSCGKAFAFDTQWQILDSARDRALRSGVVTQLNRTNHDDMPLFLSNHDYFAGGRPYSYLTECSSCGHINSANVDGYLKVASSIMLLSSSTPFVYYGEEVGMSGPQVSDPILRVPMSWAPDIDNAGFTTVVPYRAPADNVLTNNVADQDLVSDSLLNHYRELLAVRLTYPVISLGTLDVQSSAGNTHLIFTRSNETDTAVVLINLSTSAQTLQASVSASTDFQTVVPSTPDIISSNGSGALRVDVPAQSVVVLIQQ